MKKLIFVVLFICLSAICLKAAEVTGYKLGDKAICPVTGESFTITKDANKAEYDGKTYYFCCPDCISIFKSNPKKFVRSSGGQQSEIKGKPFSCKHCGLVMSVNNLDQKCKVCKCGKTARECMGK